MSWLHYSTVKWRNSQIAPSYGLWRVYQLLMRIFIDKYLLGKEQLFLLY
jgi:hypothetical protein